MADESAIALASIGASVTVAVLVPWLSSRLELKRLRLQVDENRLDGISVIIDELAAAIEKATYELNGAMSLLDMGLEHSEGDEEHDVPHFLGAGVTHIGAGNLAAQRLSLRLTRSNFVVVRGEAALAALTSAWEAMTHVTWSNVPYQDRKDRVEEGLEAARVSFQDLFVEAAQLIGPKTVPRTEAVSR